MAKDSINTATEQILALDYKIQKLLRAGWPEAWLLLNLPLGSTRALLALEGGYANTPGGIADVLNVSRTTVTGMLDRLEAEKLITRAIDPADRRSFTLALTEEGRSLIRQIDSVRREQLTPALAAMDAADLMALQQGLTALMAALRLNRQVPIQTS